tara:strand:+ start:221 stop:349 length:129 start_codon:yes stop_codon:yes gene_type:complete
LSFDGLKSCVDVVIVLGCNFSGDSFLPPHEYNKDEIIKIKIK